MVILWATIPSVKLIYCCVLLNFKKNFYGDIYLYNPFEPEINLKDFLYPTSYLPNKTEEGGRNTHKNIILKVKNCGTILSI